MPVEMRTLIDELGATAREARQVIREMHEQQQALKATIKEARELQSGIRESIAKAPVHEEIEKQVETQIEALGEETRKAMDVATGKVMREFEKLADAIGVGRRDHSLRDDVTAWANRRALR
jgi:Asp-tRNA(Asn)/Glu-tRNA(Gln) amidotransferase B subunit